MYAIVDIETTGGHASANGITEIAVYVHDGNRTVQHFTTLINPEQKLPAFITALTGISNAMLATAPLFSDVAPKLYELLSGNIFVAHNVNFDFSFVQHHLKKCGFDLNVKKLCTVRLSRKTFPGLPSYSLGKLCASLNINIEDRHRADGDARATETLFNKILAAGGLKHINDMLKRTSAEQWLPTQLDKKNIEVLPPVPGVYYFHDAKGKIIYVGKAVNIKKRVVSHFTHNDSGNRRQQFLRLVSKISYKECASELHALVLESTEIKRLWPRYNYSQKQPAQKYGLYSFDDGRGYTRLAIDKRKKNLQAAYLFNMLYEGQVLLKKMIAAFDLNYKLCYLDKAPLTEEDMAFLEEPCIYNNKVKNALLQLQQELPTFVLVDKAANSNEHICFLIEQGCFWGMGYLSASTSFTDIALLKQNLQPFADNDFIRNSIYNYASANPEKRIVLK